MRKALFFVSAICVAQMHAHASVITFSTLAYVSAGYDSGLAWPNDGGTDEDYFYGSSSANSGVAGASGSVPTSSGTYSSISGSIASGCGAYMNAFVHVDYSGGSAGNVNFSANGSIAYDITYSAGASGAIAVTNTNTVEVDAAAYSTLNVVGFTSTPISLTKSVFLAAGELDAVGSGVNISGTAAAGNYHLDVISGISSAPIFHNSPYDHITADTYLMTNAEIDFAVSVVSPRQPYLIPTSRMAKNQKPLDLVTVASGTLVRAYQDAGNSLFRTNRLTIDNSGRFDIGDVTVTVEGSSQNSKTIEQMITDGRIFSSTDRGSDDLVFLISLLAKESSGQVSQLSVIKKISASDTILESLQVWETRTSAELSDVLGLLLPSSSSEFASIFGTTSLTLQSIQAFGDTSSTPHGLDYPQTSFLVLAPEPSALVSMSIIGLLLPRSRKV